MAYENLKNAIRQAIKQNGNQEITGPILQSTLLNIVDNIVNNIAEVVQESGEAEDKVMSQKAVSDKLSDLAEKQREFQEWKKSEYTEVHVDSNYHLLESRDKVGKKTIYTSLSFNQVIDVEYLKSEYLKLEVDSNYKIHHAIKKDGTHVFNKLEGYHTEGVINTYINNKKDNADVNDITDTNGLTWNAIGTSVTQGYYSDGGDGSNGAELLTPKLYVAQVADELGLTARNYGAGGTTLAKRDTSTSSIVERTCGLNGRPTLPDADIWTIEGAPNDLLYHTKLGNYSSSSYEIDTIYGALKRIIEYVQDRPNNPRLMLILWCFQKYEHDNEKYAYDIEKAYKWASHHYGVPFLNLRECSGLSPSNIYRMTIGDGVHPSPNGTNMFKHKIAKFIKNNL